MTHADAFLADILARPDDDAPRLLYADWLDERGDPRGDFIRVQCALCRLTFAGFVVDEPEIQDLVDDLRRRERELLDANQGSWLDWLKAAWGSEWVPVRECGVEWRRGFVEVLTCTADAWLQHADALTAAAPIREVRLTTRPPLEYDGLGERDRFVSRIAGRMPPCQWHFWGQGDAPLTIDGMLSAEWPRIKFALPR